MTELADVARLFPTADAQVSLLPASNDFIPIILNAVSNIGAVEGLTATTDAISTHLSARTDILFDTIADVITRAAASDAHLIFPILAVAHAADRSISLSPSEAYVPPIGKSDTFIASQFSLLGNAERARRYLRSLSSSSKGLA